MRTQPKRRRGDTGERTCVGTRTIASQEELIRWFVGPDDTHWPDWTGQTRGRFGRGIYTLRTPKAIEQAISRRQLQGNLATLMPRVHQASERAFWDRLGLACRAGEMAIGQVSVRERLTQKPAPALLILAEDAGKAGVERVHDHALHHGANVLWVRDGFALGAALGREYVSCALLNVSAFSRDISAWAPFMVQYEGSVVSLETSAPENLK